MSERSTLHWLMGSAEHASALQQCLQLATAEDSILLLGEAVLLLLRPEFEQQYLPQHVCACAEHWQQLTAAAAPVGVELVTWSQIVALIRQHPLQQSWP